MENVFNCTSTSFPMLDPARKKVPGRKWSFKLLACS